MARMIHCFENGTIVEEEVKERSNRRFIFRIWNRWETDIRYIPDSEPVRRVRTPSGHVFEFVDPKRAMFWGAIWDRTGGTRFVVDNGLIPADVGALGNPAIAVYLSGVHMMPLDEIAEILNVSKQTVVQYRSDFVEGRR